MKGLGSNDSLMLVEGTSLYSCRGEEDLRFQRIPSSHCSPSYIIPCCSRRFSVPQERLLGEAQESAVEGKSQESPIQQMLGSNC